MKNAFDRSKHVYKNDQFDELIKDAVRFFNGTPVHSLPTPASFSGTGVYALYYTGKAALYKTYGELNRLAYNAPIYVGKAVPRGWRQARTSDSAAVQSNELHSRLREHSRNIGLVDGVDLEDFMCRFVIFEDTASDMIGTVEAKLIKIHRPLWNVALDGFGNHDPGSGRYEQARSDWDVIHPGRLWAHKCMGKATQKEVILQSIQDHLNSLG